MHEIFWVWFWVKKRNSALQGTWYPIALFYCTCECIQQQWICKFVCKFYLRFLCAHVYTAQFNRYAKMWVEAQIPADIIWTWNVPNRLSLWRVCSYLSGIQRNNGCKRVTSVVVIWVIYNLTATCAGIVSTTDLVWQLPLKELTCWIKCSGWNHSALLEFFVRYFSNDNSTQEQEEYFR